MISSSCETEIDLGDIAIKPHLVLNASLSNADTSRIYISESRPIFHSSNTSQWGEGNFLSIANADVDLLINNNNKTKERLQYSIKDSSYLYLKPLKASDQLSIEVQYKDKKINAQTSIPNAPEILSVDTFSFSKGNSYGQDYLRFHVKIKDQAVTKNFYRITVDFAQHRQSFWPGDGGYWTRSSQFISDDPVLTNGSPNSNNQGDDDFGMIIFPTNYFGIFHDAAFNGEEYLLDFYVSYPLFISQMDYYDKGHLRVNLQTISEDLYKYYFSLQRYMHSLNDGFIEPAIVFSNINKGLGILGAYNEVSVIKLEEK